MSELPQLPRFMVAEGVIGVGKTTLIEALSSRLDARTVFEVFEENPFLRDFYQDQARYALSTEMFFLLSRFNQQELFAQEDLLQRHSVSDYLFEKCRLFAGLTLASDEFALFSRVYEILARQVPKPDLVLYLTAPVDVLMERIAARGRDYERSITADYLAELDLRYRSYFASYTDAPVLIVDTTRIDFRDAAQLEQLMARMATGQGGELDADSLGQLPLEQFAARLEVER
ncbi:MAG: deoxynucleoside kinase [Deltaproteobacteria bacterium]|nr:deoxynucleoside kinase [Deltaproteobacteria bacterium]